MKVAVAAEHVGVGLNPCSVVIRVGGVGVDGESVFGAAGVVPVAPRQRRPAVGIRVVRSGKPEPGAIDTGREPERVGHGGEEESERFDGVGLRPVCVPVLKRLLSVGELTVTRARK